MRLAGGTVPQLSGMMMLTWGNSCTEGKRWLPGDGKHWLPGETVAQGRKNIAVGNHEQDSFWLLKQARCLC